MFCHSRAAKGQACCRSRLATLMGDRSWTDGMDAKCGRREEFGYGTVSIQYGHRRGELSGRRLGCERRSRCWVLIWRCFPFRMEGQAVAFIPWDFRGKKWADLFS
ncbi:hypothetical protein ACMYSQ_003707 [Aspergillus niger]